MRLILLKTAGREVICDEHGNALEGVIDFTYTAPAGEHPILTLKVVASEKPMKWDAGLPSELGAVEETDEDEWERLNSEDKTRESWESRPGNKKP